MKTQILENGEQYELTESEMRGLTMGGMISYCPDCGPNARVYHVNDPFTLAGIRQVIEVIRGN